MPTTAVLALAAAVAIPSPLSLRQALELNQRQGFDVRMAELAVGGAAGDVRAAHGFSNPVFIFGQSKARHFGIHDPAAVPAENPVATDRGWTWGISDTALFDALVGKRFLRQDVAEAGLSAATSNHEDAKRLAAFAVKQAYAQALLAQATLELQTSVSGSYQHTVQLTQSRYTSGAISEIDLAKIQTAQMEVNQAEDVARQQFLQAKAQLAFLMGSRDGSESGAASFQLEGDLVKTPKMRPQPLSELLRLAKDKRPDLHSAQANKARADAALRLAERQRVPDITLAYSYTELGQYQNAITPPTMQLSISAAIPVLYQQQGEIQRASHDRAAAEVNAAKADASLANDVVQARLAVDTTRQLVERMEKGLLERAQKARDLTEATYQKGAATLLDFLDAERTFIAARLEYLTDLQNHRIAIAQLEQAVGIDLSQP